MYIVYFGSFPRFPQRVRLNRHILSHTGKLKLEAPKPMERKSVLNQKLGQSPMEPLPPIKSGKGRKSAKGKRGKSGRKSAQGRTTTAYR